MSWLSMVVLWPSLDAGCRVENGERYGLLHYGMLSIEFAGAQVTLFQPNSAPTGKRRAWGRCPSPFSFSLMAQPDEHIGHQFTVNCGSSAFYENQKRSPRLNLAT